MSKKKRNISSESETKEIEAVTDIAEEDEDSIFYDNTAGTIFAADSDAETGRNKEEQKTAKKREKQKACHSDNSYPDCRRIAYRTVFLGK